MRSVVTIKKSDIRPSLAVVLRSQGIDDPSSVSGRVKQLAEMALIILHDLATPAGIVMDIGRSEFEAVYRGEGLNEDSTPLSLIAPAAAQFALFAVTLGSGVSERISLLFDEQEFALGALLDGAASESAEMACRAIGTEYRRTLTLQGRLNNGHGVLPFSPGYCGWHISAQRSLFDLLRPGDIGIALGETFLMEPLKSVSAVLVAAPKEAFVFVDDFPFCATCATRTCRDRIQTVMTGIPGES